ncbi:MAG: hypothetical protein VR70_14015 [Rhodospirillaceae bacterium BRH_c57]|nr:MAG: hypothetical protein VR70_14015 [Rhodospirillaceae bacterium BRH_c57]
MPGTPTACHAYNLFSLTMESRYGSAWRSCVAPEAIANLADEIVQGFGGRTAGSLPVPEMDRSATVWQFPDGSRAHTGRFGLRREDDSEEKAA